jgi:hypothetical protein
MLWTALASLLLTTQPGHAATFTVTRTADSGTGSLRWAITQANTHPGADIIVFAPAMSGRTISPTVSLPFVTDPRTTINGDINGDGAPDVALNGASLPAEPDWWALGVFGYQCTIKGLAFVGCPRYGLILQGHSCTVRSCYFGVSLRGRPAAANGWADLAISWSNDNTIGGTVPSQRNVFASTSYGVFVWSGSGNLIVGNYFGVRPDGSAALGTGGVGIDVSSQGGFTSSGNTIGGASSGARNLFGGLATGVILDTQAVSTSIEGNYFGLAADGNTALATSKCGIQVSGSAAANTIGGTAGGAGNVFAGGHEGVRTSSNGAGNVVQGNLFGSNAAGTAQRDLTTGVHATAGAVAQVIGGATARAANYFTPGSASGGTGVYLDFAGSTSLIQGNRFGIRHDGTAVPLDWGVIVDGVSATLTENAFAQCGTGVLSSGTGARAGAFGNTFRTCTYAVLALGSAHCALGNLSNASTADDGGNGFNASNTWDVWNDTPNPVRAEGNRWGTTSAAVIEAKVWDKRDSGALGRVDFVPLQGGAMPSGGAESVTGLALSGATAIPTAGGAEVLFTLSTPAQVTVEVLNLAGRPVALLAQDSPTGAGLQRLVWSGRSLTGTAAPAGRYVARITAHDASGPQATAIAPLQIGR